MRAIHWFEIPVTNIDRSATLHAKILGSELEREDFNRVPHAIFSAPEPHTGGARLVDPRRKPSPGTGTVIYVNAPAGGEACVARAVAAGAKVVVPRTSSGPMGACAQSADLDGNVIGLHEPAAR